MTLVLVGSETWKRKHVDWEISSSIRQTRHSSRSGLLGILLPTYPRSRSDQYDPFTIPPRLSENIDCGYAKIYNWVESPQAIESWIHEAFQRRTRVKPDNSYQMFANNRPGSQWQ